MREIKIIRVGSCNNCGYCCRGSNCPHFSDPDCLIHNERADPCELCEETHTDCIASPMYPMRRANPDCGYRFYISGEPLEAIEITTTVKE